MANENMDMKRMQEEAIHRVQEMQNRANQQLRGAPPFALRQEQIVQTMDRLFQVERMEIMPKSPLITHQMNKAALYMGTTEILRQMLLPSLPDRRTLWKTY